MQFGRKSEFNDPYVQKHRKNAAKRPNRTADVLAGIIQKVSADFQQPVDPRISLLKDEWAGIAGAQIAKYSEPLYIDQFILHITVTHPGWMPELERIKRLILQKVQQKHPGLKIRQLRFVLLHR